MGAVGTVFRSPIISGQIGSRRPTGIFKPQDTPVGKILPKEMLGVAANMEPKQAVPTYTQPKQKALNYTQPKLKQKKRQTKKIGAGKSILVDDDELYGI